MAQKTAVSIDVVIKEGKDGLKKLSLDADGLRKIMKENIKVAQRFEKKIFGFAALTTSISAISNAFGQLSGTLQSLTAESAEFSKAMHEANTMAGKDAAGFDMLKSQVAVLAKEIPIARDLLANGLYQTISNGVPEDNWIEYLKTSARSAVGGLADINKVVGVTATLIKNYGLEWSAAAEIQDKIQLTAKKGVTSFEQLAQALPRVAGNAATLGVSINELMGTFATLTGVSGNTAEVSTQLAAIFTALVKPSSDAAKMAAEMGIQFDAASIKAAGGFQNFLAQLDKSVKTYAKSAGVLEQEVYGRLFGSAEALRALIPLQGELADKFSDNVAIMVDSAGTMDVAFEEMDATGGAVAQKLKNKFAAITDVFNEITAGAKPILIFISEIGSSGASVLILAEGFKKFGNQVLSVAKSTKILQVVTKTLILPFRMLAIEVRSLGMAFQGSAVSATALKIALRGLLMASVIGTAIMGIVYLFDLWTNSANAAADATERAVKAGKDFKPPYDVAEEGYKTTEVRAGESYEDRISRLKDARAKNVERIKKIKSVSLLASRKGKATEEELQRALAEMDALRDQNRRIDKGIKQARAKQKKEQGVVVYATKGNNPSVTKGTKEQAPKGSIAELDKRISDINNKIRFEIDPESRTKLYNELLGLENQKRRIEFEYKFPDKVEKPDIMPDLGKVETDITKIKPEIIDVSNAFSNTGDEAEMTTEAMANGFGDLFSSLSGLGSALELPELNVAGTMAQAVATMVASFAKAWNTTGTMGPLAWLAFGATGLAQLTAIVSSVKSLPAFANGGIVSGPTVGLIGEYAGASNNPEVVAPLGKLRGMLNPVGAPVIVGGTLRASGRDLVCVLANETRIASKSGLRTNIKF